MISRYFYSTVFLAHVAFAFNSTACCGVDVDQIDLTTKEEWCGNATSTCGQLAQNIYQLTPTQAKCNESTLEYTCQVYVEGERGLPIDYYTKTIPWYLCNEWIRQCFDTFAPNTDDRKKCEDQKCATSEAAVATSGATAVPTNANSVIPTGASASPTSSSSSTSPITSSQASSSGLSTGAKAGIGIGAAALFVLAVGMLLWFLWWRKRNQQAQHVVAQKATQDMNGAEDLPAYQADVIHDRKSTVTGYAAVQQDPAVELASERHDPVELDSRMREGTDDGRGDAQSFGWNRNPADGQ